MTQRSDPEGAHITFSITSTQPIVTVEFDLLDDNEPALPMMFPANVGQDGRYWPGHNAKFVRNGLYPLAVRAWDTDGVMGETVCRPGITVDF